LPGGDFAGISTISAIHPDMPIVLIAQELSVEASREALRRGASDMLIVPHDLAELLPAVIERNLERCRLEKRRLTQKSTGIMLQTIEALVAAIDAKDHCTVGHSQRVTALALAISDELDISNEERYALELAAKLHDIGKLGLPDGALNKQSPLTQEEWLAMREHPSLGSRIVGAIDDLAYVSTVIRHHHERLDGTGYPDGLKGPAIPYLARIIAVADSYEAMTSERAHRGRLTPSEAVQQLQLESGKHCSPEIIEILRRHLVASGEIPEEDGDKQAA
jgi:putative two-component system response regulator